MTGRRLLLTLVALAAAAPCRLRAQEGETVRIQPELARLRLGERLKEIQKIYPPLHPWPSERELKRGVNRIRIERSSVRDPAPHVDTMWLGLRHDRLVEVQLIYDAGYTRERPVERLARELSLIYGRPRRSQGKFWWADGKTVLRAFYAEVPVRKDGVRAVELRTSLQVLDAGLFEKD